MIPGKRKKMKNKDHNPSLLSFSVAATKKESGTAEVVGMSKKVVEKLSFLVNSHKEFVDKSQKQLYLMSGSGKEDKLCELYELLNLHKMMMGRSQLGIYDATFLITLGESADVLEAYRVKLRNEAKRYSTENKELKTKLTYLINRLIEMEGNLAKAREEMNHWETLSQMRLLDGEEEADRLEAEVWETAIHPDHKDPIIPQEMEEIQDLINEGKVVEAISMVNKYTKSKKSKPGKNEAGVLCLLARRCSEENKHKTAIEIIDLAILLRKEALGINHPYVAFTLSAKAMISGKSGQLVEASKHAFDALQVMEVHYQKDQNEVNLGRQYMISGFFLAKWQFPEDGIQLMEFALLIFYSMLPSEENLWMQTIVRMAKTCNDFKFHDDTMTVCCELIDYFHERIYGPISNVNQPIYEIASDCQRADSVSAKLISLNGPRPTYVPPLVAATLREIIIAFAARYEFGSARVVENYLKECLKFDNPNIINSSLIEEGDIDKDTKQNIIARRLSRQNIFSSKKKLLNMTDKVTSKNIADKIAKSVK